MTGPSGVDAPAADNPSMIGDPFRAFAAATQGDWARTVRLMVAMSEEDWRSLAEVVGGTYGVLHAVEHIRRENARIAAERAPTDPAAPPPR